jgi:hypothetical protein
LFSINIKINFNFQSIDCRRGERDRECGKNKKKYKEIEKKEKGERNRKRREMRKSNNEKKVIKNFGIIGFGGLLVKFLWGRAYF